MELKFFNPFAETLVGENRLPHWDQPGVTYFITFRLADSLPAPLLAQWREEREAWLKWNPEPWSREQEALYHKKFSGALERWLDEGHGECLLRQQDVREAVEDVFTKFDGERYQHHAWVLMPNHAHLLFTMSEGIELSKLLKAWKGASSRAVGLVLRKSGVIESGMRKAQSSSRVPSRHHNTREATIQLKCRFAGVVEAAKGLASYFPLLIIAAEVDVGGCVVAKVVFRPPGAGHGTFLEMCKVYPQQSSDCEAAGRRIHAVSQRGSAPSTRLKARLRRAAQFKRYPRNRWPTSQRF
jgi:putative transposase